jgi:ribonuclease PH
MNFVMTGAKRMVEVQATAEQRPFDDAQLKRMVEFAKRGVESLIARQQAVLSNLLLLQ